MKYIIDGQQNCPDCKGTGIYVGQWVKNGAGVLCHRCKGTGCAQLHFEYESFEARGQRTDIKQVFECNPGICISENDALKLEDFGGMSYDNWIVGNPFPKQTEMRRFTCPAWWYQIADYKLQPGWKECIGIGIFGNCPFFTEKNACWGRWDKEHLKVKNENI